MRVSVTHPLRLDSRIAPGLALALCLGACAGDGTLGEVEDDAGAQSCDGDAGVCEGGAAERDRIEVDCCETDTEVQRTLCEDLYGGTAPEGLIIIDTCDQTPEPAPEPTGPTDPDPTDPCAGLTGLEAVFCDVTSLFGGGEGTPDPQDPCDGLEGVDLLLCQASGALGFPTGQPEPVATGPLADVINGINALADIANGLNTLAQVLGLADLFGGNPADPGAATGDAGAADAGAGDGGVADGSVQ